ncbi:MAG: glycosyltransferase [Candidatus Thermoplasmatota archaeon]|nr:glycosyltransferase [Candidatus Thermoplasmatota archaeon]MDH7506255.1 glycosyltransferase [Candidatus Thermoplasmatota archaeon]
MKKHKILYPPTVNWNLLFQRPNQILKVLARHGYLSYFMNHTPHIKEQFVSKNIMEIEKNLFIVPLFEDPKKINPNVIYYSYPDHHAFITQMKPKYNIFDVIDAPVKEFKGWKRNWFKCIEDADLVMASAKILYEQAKEHNDNVISVPNGVEYEHYQGNKRNPYKKLHKQHKGFDPKKPIIGFSGAIATWIDLNLLIGASLKYPEYNFVIMGMEYNVKLKKFPPNLFFIGHKNYAQLPQWINHMDVCTLPFIPHTDVANACNPLKFWEYLASGNPIVSTALPETKVDHIYWCESNEEYLESIPKAVEEKQNGNKNADKRRKIAKKNSWDNCCKPLLEVLEQWD